MSWKHIFLFLRRCQIPNPSSSSFSSSLAVFRPREELTVSNFSFCADIILRRRGCEERERLRRVSLQENKKCRDLTPFVMTHVFFSLLFFFTILNKTCSFHFHWYEQRKNLHFERHSSPGLCIQDQTSILNVRRKDLLYRRFVGIVTMNCSMTCLLHQGLLRLHLATHFTRTKCYHRLLAKEHHRLSVT